MPPIKRPYPPEFRREAVELTHTSERSISQVARDLGISNQTLRNWIKQADVDLSAGRLRVTDSKTDAGVRLVDLLPPLREELSAHKTETRFGCPEDFVFPTESGRMQDRNNARRRVVVKSVERASENLIGQGLNPLPEGITPHSLRRTFISCCLRLARRFRTLCARSGIPIRRSRSRSTRR